jgi:hypothetical protein
VFLSLFFAISGEQLPRAVGAERSVADMTGTVICVDRESAERAAPYLHAMGGGWDLHGARFAQDHRKRFLLLMAHTPARQSLRDPIVYLCQDGIELRQRVREWATTFRQTELHWQLLMQRESDSALMILALLPPASTAVFS